MENRTEEKKAVRRSALAARDAIPVCDRIARSQTACAQIEHLLTECFAHQSSQLTTGDSKKREANDAKEGRKASRTAQGEQEGEGTRHANETTDRVFASAPVVAVYFAMKSEVNLDALIRACFARGWSVCFPCMMKTPEPLPMGFYFVTPSQLAKHPKGSCGRSEGNAATSKLNNGKKEGATQSTEIRASFPFDPTESGNRRSGSSTESGASFPRNPLQRFTPEELEQLGFHHVDPHEIDAIIVPMTAFDSHGNRLGYGGGNYDRYLPLLREDTAIIGAAFNEQKVEAVPTDPHDLPLPLIVQA